LAGFILLKYCTLKPNHFEGSAESECKRHSISVPLAWPEMEWWLNSHFHRSLQNYLVRQYTNVIVEKTKTNAKGNNAKTIISKVAVWVLQHFSPLETRWNRKMFII